MSKKIDFASYLKQARRSRSAEIDTQRNKNSKGASLFLSLCEEIKKITPKFDFNKIVISNHVNKAYIAYHTTELEIAPYDDGVIVMIAGQCVGSLATTIDGAFKNIAEKIAEHELPDLV